MILVAGGFGGLQVLLNGAEISHKEAGLSHNATTELTPPAPAGNFSFRFVCPARGVDFLLEPIPIVAAGNYEYELEGDTIEQLQLVVKPKSAGELLPQLRRCFYFLQHGNAATYDSSRFCDACEGQSLCLCLCLCLVTVSVSLGVCVLYGCLVPD